MRKDSESLTISSHAVMQKIKKLSPKVKNKKQTISRERKLSPEQQISMKALQKMSKNQRIQSAKSRVLSFNLKNIEQ